MFNTVQMGLFCGFIGSLVGWMVAAIVYRHRSECGIDGQATQRRVKEPSQNLVDECTPDLQSRDARSSMHKYVTSDTCSSRRKDVDTDQRCICTMFNGEHIVVSPCSNYTNNCRCQQCTHYKLISEVMSAGQMIRNDTGSVCGTSERRYKCLGCFSADKCLANERYCTDCKWREKAR